MRRLFPLRHSLPGPLHRHRRRPKAPGPTARNIPRVFTIDELRCIYCGMCEEACPVDAIELTSFFDLTGRSREEMIFDKEKLLSVFDQTKDGEPMPSKRVPFVVRLQPVPWAAFRLKAVLRAPPRREAIHDFSPHDPRHRQPGDGCRHLVAAAAVDRRRSVSSARFSPRSASDCSPRRLPLVGDWLSKGLLGGHRHRHRRGGRGHDHVAAARSIAPSGSA